MLSLFSHLPVLKKTGRFISLLKAAEAGAVTIYSKNFIIIPPEAGYQGKQKSDSEDVPADFELD